MQFATKDPIELGLAAEKVRAYAKGIDINCGCPQKWAMKQGIGAVMSEQPALVAEMVREVRKRGMQCSVKIRIRSKRNKPDVRATVDLVKAAERAGVAWVTVHGRTVHMRKEPVDFEAIKVLKEAASVPIIANGDIKSLAQADEVVARTGVDGVMCAQGILDNPALFAGHDKVPLKCANDYLQLAVGLGGNFACHHYHLMAMMHSRLNKTDRREFSLLRSMCGVVDFFDSREMLLGQQAS